MLRDAAILDLERWRNEPLGELAWTHEWRSLDESTSGSSVTEYSARMAELARSLRSQRTAA